MRVLRKFRCVSKVVWPCERLRTSVAAWLRKWRVTEEFKGIQLNAKLQEKDLDNSWEVLLQEVTVGREDGAAAFGGVSLWSTGTPWGEPCAAKSQISALSLRKKACRNPLWERRGSVSFQVRSPNDRGVRELGETSKPCLRRRKRWEDMVSFSQTLGNL